MKKKLIIILIIVSVAAGGIAFFTGAKSSKSVDVANVIVKQAVKGDLIQSVNAEGSIEIKNEEDIYVSKSIRISDVYFEKNDTVKKGDKLISFDPEARNELVRKIKAANLKIEEEKLAIEEYKFPVSRINIETAERNIDELNITMIKYGEKIKIAELERENLKKELENKNKKYEINKKLFSMEGISFTELNSSEEEKDSIAKNIELKEWEIKENKIDLEDSKKSLEFAQKTLENAKKTYEEEIISRANDIKRAEIAIIQYQLEIESYQENLEKTVEYVISPVSGTITEVNAEKNFMVDTSASLMTISDIDSQIITANVSSYDINSVEVGQEVKITSDSLGKNKSITGKVEKISSMATVESGSGYEDVVVEIEISFDSKNSGLRPGYNVDLEIVTGNKKNAVTVPTFAVNTDKSGKSFVMLLQNGDTVAKKTVKTGIKTSTSVEILNLNGNEKIIMNGSKLKDGDKVTVVDKMTSKVGKESANNRRGPRP